MDVELLSRLQFAFTIMFHDLFPPLTIRIGTCHGHYWSNVDSYWLAFAITAV